MARTRWMALLMGLWAGCSTQGEPPASSGSTRPAQAAESQTTGPGVHASASSGLHGRALAVHTELALEVKDVPGAARKLRRLVERHAGYVADATIGADTASVEARVPADGLGALRRELRALGKVTSETEQVDDEGDHLVDLEARLRSLRTQERRLLALMQNATGDLSDVLEVERRLGEVRAEIERMDLEHTRTEERVHYATVTVHLQATATAPTEPSAWQRIAAASRDGVDGAKALVVGLVVAGAAVGPSLGVLLLFAGLLLVIVRRFRRPARRM